MNLREHLLKTGTETSLRRVIFHLASRSKKIVRTLRSLGGEYSDSTNVFGEKQLRIDVVSNKLFRDGLRDDTSFGIFQYASEEEEKVIVFNESGHAYSVAADPLDGNTAAKCNRAVGTIVGVFKGPLVTNEPARESIAGAMYIQYGPGHHACLHNRPRGPRVCP